MKLTLGTKLRTDLYPDDTYMVCEGIYSNILICIDLDHARIEGDNLGKTFKSVSLYDGDTLQDLNDRRDENWRIVE